MIITLIVLLALTLGVLGGAAMTYRPALVVKEPERELVPLVPSAVRKKHPDQWVN